MTVSKDERVFAALIFGLSFITTFIGPLIIWLLKKNESPYVDYYGKMYLNFTISYVIYSFIAGVSMVILIGFILLPIGGLAALIFTIIRLVKAYEGTYYKIPFIIEIFKL